MEHFLMSLPGISAAIGIIIYIMRQEGKLKTNDEITKRVETRMEEIDAKLNNLANVVAKIEGRLFEKI